MGGVRLGFPLKLDDAAIKRGDRSLGTVSHVKPNEVSLTWHFGGGSVMPKPCALRRLVMPFTISFRI